MVSAVNIVVQPRGLGPYFTQRGSRGVLMPSRMKAIGLMVSIVVIIIVSVVFCGFLWD